MSGLLENVSRIEPCSLHQVPAAIADRAVQLGMIASRLGSALTPETAGDLAQLVRVMNCYYSNLIEGHNTRPRDIERALGGQFDDAQRDLQLEARAHIRVQAQIDELAGNGALPNPASVEFIRWIHREFYRDAPESLLLIDHPTGAYQMVPGQFRSHAKHEVTVGRHQPPSSQRVAEFMGYFEEKCSLVNKGPADALITLAIAHHRFNYIHPFPDGNGRVSRLRVHGRALPN
jgi:Fic family protein